MLIDLNLNETALVIAMSYTYEGDFKDEVKALRQKIMECKKLEERIAVKPMISEKNMKRGTLAKNRK